jgi:hypothetical protein
MRSIAVTCCLIVLAGCAKPEQQAAAKDTTAATMGAGAPAELSLATIAGKWNFQTRAVNSDSVLVSYEMITTADQNGWVINFPGRPPVPVRVISNGGDSVVTEAGPYESVLRKGVQVTTNSVMHFQDNKLVGTTVAHYSKGADTVLNLRTEGVRAQ